MPSPPTQLATGAYPYTLKGFLNYTNSAIGSSATGKVLVNNERNSPFGAGWTLDGLQKLNFNQDGSIALTEGDGGIKRFSPPSYLGL
jgi:hypothetical protein